MANKKPDLYSDMDMRLFIESDGDVQVHEGTDVIKQSIKMILATVPGERVMNPEFGSGLRNYLFEPMSEDVAQEMEETIKTDLTDFEPRIQVIDVSVRGFLEEQRYEISVSYVMDSGKKDTFVGRVRALSME